MSKVQTGNLRGAIPHELPEELTTVLAGGGAVRIERIVSRGHASPEGSWYEQEEDEFVLLVEGSARVELADGGEIALGPQDYVLIPARVRHRVSYTASDRDTVWLAVFFPSRA